MERTLFCASCGRGFVPQSEAWGEGICGVCIGERIHGMLLNDLAETLRARRPMRRGADLAELPHPDADPVERKFAGS